MQTFIQKLEVWVSHFHISNYRQLILYVKDSPEMTESLSLVTVSSMTNNASKRTLQEMSLYPQLQALHTFMFRKNEFATGCRRLSYI